MWFLELEKFSWKEPRFTYRGTWGPKYIYEEIGTYLKILKSNKYVNMLWSQWNTLKYLWERKFKVIHCVTSYRNLPLLILKLPVEQKHCWGGWPASGQNALANHWNAAAAAWRPGAGHGLKSEDFLSALVGKRISPMCHAHMYQSIHISVLKNPNFYWFVCFYERKVRIKIVCTVVLQEWPFLSSIWEMLEMWILRLRPRHTESGGRVW